MFALRESGLQETSEGVAEMAEQEHRICAFGARESPFGGLQPWSWTAGCLCGAFFTGCTIKLGGSYTHAREAVGNHAVKVARAAANMPYMGGRYGKTARTLDALFAENQYGDAVCKLCGESVCDASLKSMRKLRAMFIVHIEEKHDSSLPLP